jgi:hypothetical protein
LQSLKGNKQRTSVEAENALAHLFEPDGYPISMHGFERQRFKNEHIQSALDEIIRLVRHLRIPPEDQEEEYTSPPECQEENHNSLRRMTFTSPGLASFGFWAMTGKPETFRVRRPLSEIATVSSLVSTTG